MKGVRKKVHHGWQRIMLSDCWTEPGTMNVPRVHKSKVIKKTFQLWYDGRMRIQNENALGYDKSSLFIVNVEGTNIPLLR
jgi:hypothetical protein